jgi:COP9 signalosome complex subunit 3
MNETQLTSIHANLLQLCLMSQNLKPALEFLNVDISEINPEVLLFFRLLSFYYNKL